jgi:nitrogen fixation protein NifU and related proteins
MPSQRLLDHFRNPRNVGELAPPAICIDAVNPACGDMLRLCAEVKENRISAVTFKARGCPASIAAGSALTEIIMGRTRSELVTVDNQVIDDALDGLEPASKHAAQLCVDAIKVFLTKWP